MEDELFLAQSDLLDEAASEAGLAQSPDGNVVDYVEVSGTGQREADLREMGMITSCYAVPHANAQDGVPPLLFGCVKANIGSLDGASGMAGLIKAINVVKRGKVPPQIHLEGGPPEEVQNDGRVAVPTRLTDLVRRADGRPFRAGVNSFSPCGTLAHAIVEEFREGVAQQRWGARPRKPVPLERLAP